MPKHLTRKEAAAFLQEQYGFGSVRLLAQLAVTGEGPKYARVGRSCLYPAAELRAWADGKLSQLHASAKEHRR